MPAEWGAPVAFTGASPSAPAASWAPVPAGRKTPASKAKVITIVMGCAVIIGLGLSVLINRANGTGPFGAADTWASYTPADRSFTLEAPGTVEITDIPLTTADGTPFTETDYSWRTPDGGAVLLGTSVLPPLAGLDPVEGTIASLESRGLVIERLGAGSVGSIQTSEWVGHTNVDGREVATRGTAFLNGDRLFFIVASADGGADDFGDYERMEQSLRLPG
jgi:rubredoxin